MEERKYEEKEQIASDFKCQNILPAIEKSTSLSPRPMQRPEIFGSQHLDTKIASLTPEKANEPLHNRNKVEAAELPEKYRIIAEYFDRMTCSLRLLTLRKKLPIFQNISRQVEILTGRKFSYRHLAQIKYILPEAVRTNKILIQDEKTLCVETDIKITLLFEVVEGHHNQSTFIALQQVFASRLLNFSSMHPEGCEIPEAEMPVPFNRGSDTIIIDALPVDSSTESQLSISETELLLKASHLYASFNRHFSQKVVAETEKKIRLLASPIPLSSAKFDSVIDQDIGSRQRKVSPYICPTSTINRNTVQLTYRSCCDGSTACESNPLKIVSETDNVTVQTPSQLAPKRSMPSCDNKLKTMKSQNWTACNISAKRFLDFSPMDSEQSALNSTTDEIDWLKVAQKTSPQNVETKGMLVEDNFICTPGLLRKAEESCCTGKDQNMHQTGLILHQKMSACLSDLIALIHQIFRSANYSAITKDELIHKIIMNKCDVVERREVEEQIELLEKLVPDWICRKLAPSGDLLYKIKKVSDLNSVCERLFSM